MTLLFTWSLSSTPNSSGNVPSIYRHNNQACFSFPTFFFCHCFLTFGYPRQVVPTGAYWNSGRHWGRSMSRPLCGCLRTSIDLLACQVVEVILPIGQGGRCRILRLGLQWCVLSTFIVLVLQDFSCVGALVIAHTLINFLLWPVWILLNTYCPAHVPW